MKNLTNFLKMLAGLIVAVTYSIVLAGVLFSGGWTVLAILWMVRIWSGRHSGAGRDLRSVHP